MRGKKKQTWTEWSAITKPIYLRRMNGWPAAEMRCYFDQGLSPLQAFEQALRRRARTTKGAGND